MRRKTGLIVLLTLATACLSLSVLCERLLLPHPGVPPRWLMGPGAGLMAIAGVALVRRSLRASRQLSLLHALAETDLPQPMRALADQLGLDRWSLVVINSPEPQAFCYGLMKPRICVSAGLIEYLSGNQLRAVLLHEDYHRLHFHPLRILLLDALSSAFFFLPVVGELCAIQRIKLELDADQYAVDQAGKAALAGALHRLLTRPAQQQAHVPGAAIAGFSVTEARVAYLLGEREPSPRLSMRSLALSAPVLLVACMIIL